MAVNNPIDVGQNTGLTAEHMEQQKVIIIADDPANFRLVGEYAAYKDSAAKAAGSGRVKEIRPEVTLKHADMSTEVKSAIATILAAIDDAGVADAGVAEVVGKPAVAAVVADPDKGIDAAPAVPAVKAVRGVPPGPLHGGTVV